jgi:hypothetical protein
MLVLEKMLLREDADDGGGFAVGRWWMLTGGDAATVEDADDCSNW